ncbi:MAG: tetratricopeptide repeat protein, partial [Bacteroidia bacterium]
MNKKSVLVSLFLSCSLFCFTQKKTVSTESDLKTIKQDTNYIISLNNSSRDLLGTGSLMRADSFSKKALSISEKLNFKNGTALSLNMLGQIKQMQGEYGKALEYLFRGLSIAEEIKDKTRTSRLLSTIGSNYLFQNNYQKAQDYYFKSLKLEEELNNKIGIARAYANIGITFKNKGDSSAKKNNLAYAKAKFYPIALDYFLKSLTIAETLGEERGIEVNLGNIGGIYLHIYQYDKALEFFEKSLALSEKHGDKEGSAIKLYNIGNLIAEKGDSAKSLDAKRNEYKKALSYLNHSLKLSDEAGDKQGSMLCHKTISHL